MLTCTNSPETMKNIESSPAGNTSVLVPCGWLIFNVMCLCRGALTGPPETEGWPPVLGAFGARCLPSDARVLGCPAPDEQCMCPGIPVPWRRSVCTDWVRKLVGGSWHMLFTFSEPGLWCLTAWVCTQTYCTLSSSVTLVMAPNLFVPLVFVFFIWNLPVRLP